MKPQHLCLMPEARMLAHTATELLQVDVMEQASARAEVARGTEADLQRLVVLIALWCISDPCRPCRQPECGRSLLCWRAERAGALCCRLARGTCRGCLMLVAPPQPVSGASSEAGYSAGCC